MSASLDPAGDTILQWIDPNQLTYRLTFAKDLGYALKRCDITTTKGQLRFAEVVPGDFRTIDGVQVPFAVTLREFRPRDGTLLAEYSAVVRSLLLNDPANTPDLYAMRWPKGMTVTDVRYGAEIVIPTDDYVITTGKAVQAGAQQLAQRTAVRMTRMAITAQPHRNPVLIVVSFIVVAGVALATIIFGVIAVRRRHARQKGTERG
jgi:hypothetical protein